MTRTLGLFVLLRSIAPCVASSSTLISESTTRLPMSLSTVISDLEAEGCTHLTTACFMASRSVTKNQRSALLRSLFRLDDESVDDQQLASTTAFGKKIFDDDDDGIAVAHPGRKASASEVASTVVACGGTVVYVPSPDDLARGEGLFDALAPSMERLLSQKSQDSTGRKAVLVVIVSGDVATAKAQLEQAASSVLGTLVQPDNEDRATVLEDVFDAVEYVSSDTDEFEDILCHLGGACEPTEATSSISSAVMADFSLTSAMTAMAWAPTIASGNPRDLAAARLLGPAAKAALESALKTVMDATVNKETGEMQLITNFGDLCDAAVSRAMDEFDENQQPGSAISKNIRSNLKDEIYGELGDIFEEQLKLLNLACFEDFRKNLSKLKISPNLATDMENVASESASAYTPAAKKLKAKGAPSWSFASAKTEFVKSTKDYCRDRLLVARASGQYRPLPRKGVTVGLHWLLPKPFGNDFRQEPWMVQALDNMVYVPKDKVTDVNPDEVRVGDWRRKVVPSPAGTEMIYM